MHHIRADPTEVAPRISGLVKHVNIEDYQFVQTGDELFQIDDQDIQVELRNALAQKHSSESDIKKIQSLIQQQHSFIQQSQANVQIDQSNIKLAQQDYQRFSNLAADGSGTLQAKQQAESQVQSHQAELKRNMATVTANRQQISVFQADITKANSAIESAEANIDALKLKLTYTRVTAPISGFVHQRHVRVGSYVQTGKTELTIVPLSSIYIEANFRETQLSRICEGQKVSIQVDALPNTSFQGNVQSLGMASGASLSQIAPHNATGNFTKIVQRLPIRIKFAPNQKNINKLRVGMSVRPTIYIDQTACRKQ
ncbi:HlyD family secretion protein [Acinetobacter sp. S40]|uniref:HlyD family secretion protein n=1 Tax=Acinetobacter sp. S40 TaxID=2767434 RepID=UPI00190D1003|nr:HlyD family secretion protein [Acinetobacter sp. S40]MBJ9987000.1 HlyD family secretion protein [Acinetobacter sp. S40]